MGCPGGGNLSGDASYSIAELSGMSPIPLVSLPGVTLEPINKKHFKRISLLGTRVTMESKVFGLLPGIAVVPPSADEIAVVHDAYVQIANRGAGSDELYQRLRVIAHAICDRENVAAIVLGDTELSFLFNESTCRFAARRWRTESYQSDRAAAIPLAPPGFAATKTAYFTRVARRALLIFNTMPAFLSATSLTWYSAAVPSTCAISEGVSL